MRLPRALDAALRENGRLHPVSVSVEENLTPLTTASLTLPSDDRLPLRGWVELYTEKGSAGVFRVTNVSESYTGECACDLEHGACILGDSIIPGKGTEKGALKKVLEAFLQHQTALIDGQRPWVLGDCAVEDDVSYDYEYSNILSAIIDVIGGVDGCALTLDQSVFPWRLGVKRLDDRPVCEGRLSRNLRSVSVQLDDDELCTRIYCDQLPAPGYIDGPNISAWGVVSKTISVGEGATKESLERYIRRYLDDHKDPRITVEIEAEDLSATTGESIDSFRVGQVFRLALPEYGVKIDERILSVRHARAYDDPAGVRLTLANNIRDTADDIVYIHRATTGGVSHNSVRGGGYGGGGGSGISQTSLLDMLKKTDQDIKSSQSWMREAGVRIESNATELYATKKALTGGAFSSIEQIDAIIKATTDAGGLVSMFVGKKNSVESTEAAIKALGDGIINLTVSKKVFDEYEHKVSISLDSVNNKITLKANRVDLEALITKVNGLLAGGVKAKSLYTERLAVTSDYMHLGTHDATWQSLTLVKSVSGSATGLIAVRDANGSIIGSALTGYRVSYSTETINYVGR